MLELGKAREKVLSIYDSYKGGDSYSDTGYHGDPFRAYWATIRDKGRTVHAYKGVCHGKLRHNDYSASDYEYIVSLVAPSFITKTTARSDDLGLFAISPIKYSTEYYSWLFNKSPWKDAFASKKIIQGTIVVSCDVPSNYMLGALIASRVPWEWHILKTWSKLVKEGIDPSFALMVSRFFPHPDESEECNWYGLTGAEEHWPICLADSGMSYMRNFCNSKQVHPLSKYSTSGTYGNVFALWGQTAIVKSIKAYLTDICLREHPKYILSSTGWNNTEGSYWECRKEDVIMDVIKKLQEKVLEK